MKVIVVGCTHAGKAAVKNMLNNNQKIEANVYERNDSVSFLSCGIAFYIGVVKDVNGLFYSSPAELAKLGANVFMEHNVLGVDYDSKTVTAKKFIN